MDSAIDEMFGNMAELQKEHCKMQYRIAHMQGILDKTKEALMEAADASKSIQNSMVELTAVYKAIQERKEVEYNRILECQQALMSANGKLGYNEAIWQNLVDKYNQRRDDLSNQLADFEGKSKAFYNIREELPNDALMAQVVEMTRIRDELKAKVVIFEKKPEEDESKFQDALGKFAAILNLFEICEDLLMGGKMLKETGSCWNCAAALEN